MCGVMQQGRRRLNHAVRMLQLCRSLCACSQLVLIILKYDMNHASGVVSRHMSSNC